MGFTGNILPLFLDQYVFCVETTLRENLFLELIFPCFLMTSIQTTFHNKRIVSSFTANGEKFRYVEV